MHTTFKIRTILYYTLYNDLLKSTTHSPLNVRGTNQILYPNYNRTPAPYLNLYIKIRYSLNLITFSRQ
jgi:hypothetical protein